MIRFFSALALAFALVLLVIVLAIDIAVAQAAPVPEGGPMDPATWYALVCGDDGALLKWGLRSAAAIGVMSLLQNARVVLLKSPKTAWLVPWIDIGAGNIWTFFRNAALVAAKTAPVLLVVAIVACTAQQVSMALQDAQLACTDYAPVSAGLAAAPAGSSAAVTKGYVDGACQVATGQLTAEGVAAVTKDPNTAAWIAAGTAALKVAAALTAAPPAATAPAPAK